MGKMFNRKGQTWSLDLVLAVVLFILVVSLFYAFLIKDPSNNANRLQGGASSIIYLLNGDTSTEESLIVLQNGVVNDTKLIDLYNNDVDTLRSLFGVSGNFCIFIQDSDGNLIPIVIDEVTGKYKLGVGDSDLTLTGTTSCGDSITP